MGGMRNATVCWAPECGRVPPQPPTGRPRLYCGPNCKMKAVRRNGGKAPTEPYPPFQPLQQDAAAAMVATVAPRADPPAVATDEYAGSLAAPARRRKDPSPGKPAAPPRQGKAKAPADKPMQRPDGGGVRTPPAGAKVTQLHVAVTDATVPVQITVHPMVARYRADLEQMGQAETRQGLQVLAMAEKLVSSATSPAAASGLSKELDRLMGALEENTPAAKADRDPSQLIRERTLAKLRAVAG